MPIPFIMPKFDMDQEKATIIAWSKKEGDYIEFDETILTVETEKVAIDVPAPATGILARILFRRWDVVPVTQVIAYILKEGETLADLPQLDLAPEPAKD
jgi:pyruvate/2-oxoglutarate dehydrogenase complex dihydrolipoamide acyltransferase (E2) component